MKIIIPHTSKLTSGSIINKLYKSKKMSNINTYKIIKKNLYIQYSYVIQVKNKNIFFKKIIAVFVCICMKVKK